ncbi:hypothetical protein AB0M79_35085 [Polymorphospora sp. NPDC051019]|uniref:effector-associated constant component EACC1 n=1 Tax=Polymorphospora sp. NPDC051019 TaxID=3155725 RepID=UPI003427D46F
MIVHVRLLGRSNFELLSLGRWLADEAELRGHVTTRHGSPSEGEMGTVTDVLIVAVASGGALTVLSGSIATWLRQKKSDISVEIAYPDGRVQRITASGPAADVLAEHAIDHSLRVHRVSSIDGRDEPADDSSER